MRVALHYGRTDADPVGKMRFFNWRKGGGDATFGSSRASGPGSPPTLPLTMESSTRPNPSPARRLALLLAVLGTAVLLASPGCRTTDDEMTAAVVMGVHPVSMEGSEPFFGGKVSVKVTISRGIGSGLKKHNKDERDAYAKSDTKVFAGNPVPPVTLNLIVTNNTAEQVTVRLIDFNSDLGNFAIDPDTLAIEPGQSGSPTAMVSDLGVSSDVIPFTVTLKMGTARDSRTVSVRSNLVDTAATSQPK
jgi:hypothetical protein